MKNKIILSFLLLDTSNFLLAVNPTSTNNKLESQPLLFIQNKGQLTDAEGNPAPDILFTAHNSGVELFFHNNGISYQFQKTEYSKGYGLSNKRKVHGQDLEKKIKTSTFRMDMELLGASLNPTVETDGKSGYVENYYLPNCHKGILNVPTYTKIIYKDIYPKIDWVVYTKGQVMKYDFVVHPGGNPNMIKIDYRDATATEITANGNLLIKTSLGQITDQKPLSLQKGLTVESSFELNKDIITYQIGDYDKGQDLTIDPGISWATYYGGSAYDEGEGVTTDANGNVYLAGYTQSTTSIASGGFQNSFSGSNDDAFLVKFDSSGNRLWATYFGGSSDNYGFGTATDFSGNVYLCGYTSSTSGIAIGGFQTTYPGGQQDAFLVKFDQNGNLIWSTYYGGSIGAEGYAVATDGSGNVYLGGSTQSLDNIASGGFQNTFGGGIEDDFLVKFDANGNRLWATYYGASGTEENPDITTDVNGNVYLEGTTTSTDSISWGGFQNTIAGLSYEDVGYSPNAFLVKFDGSGNRLWATYFGGSGVNDGVCVATDDSANVYMSGLTTSTSNIAYNGYQTTFGSGTQDAFLVKFNEYGNLIWSTYYGNTGSYSGKAVSTNAFGDVYLSVIPYNYYAGQESLVKFNTSGNLIWTIKPQFDILSISANNVGGSVYAGGYAGSSPNIAVNGFQNTYGGGNSDAFLMKVIECGTSPNITTQPTNQVKCINDNAVFNIGTSGTGLIYQWQYSTDGITFSNCTSGTYYSGESTNTLTVNNLSALNNYYYRCSVTSYVTCNAMSNTVRLTVNPLVYKTQNKVICLGGNIQVGNHIHTLPGTYHDTLTSSLGCDSIVVTNLSFYPGGAPVITVLDSSCNGSPATLLARCYGDTAVSFLWSNSSTDSIITTSQPGYDSVRVTTTEGCLTPYSQAFPFPAIPNCGGLLLLQSDSIINFDTLQVNVYVENADSLFSISAYLHFDSSLLQLIWDTIGNFYGPSPNNLVYQTPGSGLIDFEIASAISHVGVSGNGLLYTFKFKLLTLPNSIASNAPFTAYTLLTLSNPSILDAHGNQRDVSMPKPDTALIGIEVWPGDLNNDHVVNVLDILPIGYFYLFTGPARDLYCSPNCNQWSGQPAQIWGSNISAHNSSAYETFADANGDGVINLGDAADIQFNLGSIHALQPKSNGPTNARSIYPPLTAYTAITQIDSTQLPYTLNVSVNLGSPTMPVDYVLGIAFDLLFDADCVDTNSLTTNSVTYSNLFGTYQTDYIRVADFTQKAEGKISFGITRFGVPPINGNGDSILNVNFKLINGCNGGYFRIIPNLLGCDSADGAPILLSNVGDSVRVIATGPSAINTVKVESPIKIFPNPANDLVTIYSPNNISSVITLYDVNGQVIFTQNFKGEMQKIDISPLSSGVYIVNVRNNSETVTQKIIKE